MVSLERQLLANTLAEWLAAFGIAVGLALALLFARRVLTHRLQTWAQRTATPLDDLAAELVGGARTFFLFAVAIYAGAEYLTLPAKLNRIVTSGAIIALLLQVALWGNHAIAFWLTHTLRRRGGDPSTAASMTISGFLARTVLWSVIALMTLENLGFNITTLIASLGIGGVAVALAVQNILGDIFASLSIALDKPFVIGDFIIVDDVLGSIEYIGIKTTRLRSLSGEQIIVSNADLLKSRIRNYKRMNERRIVFGFGVVYQTSAETLARIPAVVKEIITSQPRARFDRAHFKEYGDSSLNFEVVYYVLDADYNVYMDVQQAINLELYRRFAADNIDFAYPTRTIIMQTPPVPGR
jgi:small-conductance mechanosensitive channel